MTIFSIGSLSCYFVVFWGASELPGSKLCSWFFSKHAPRLIIGEGKTKTKQPVGVVGRNLINDGLSETKKWIEWV